MIAIGSLYYDNMVHGTNYCDWYILYRYRYKYIYGSFSWKLVKNMTIDIVIDGKNLNCDFFYVIIWKWKLDISCVHKYKT